MSPFTTVRSQLVALAADDVDTDQIIPAQFVNAVGSAALADALFARVRAREPGFVFNRPELRGRAVLVVGANFGCGSSREAAVWALAAWGIRVLIGRSFNATFLANCLQNSLLAIAAPPAAHAALCRAHAADPELEVSVDLERERVSAGPIEFPTAIEPFARKLLLDGMDELDYLLERRAAIDAYERSAP